MMRIQQAITVPEGSPLRLRTSVRYLDMQLAAGAQIRRKLPVDYRGLVYAVKGNGTVKDMQ